MTRLTSFASLFVTGALLLGANGLYGTLIAIRSSIEAFSAIEIGLLASGFFAGFILGSIYTPRLIMRAGHIRVFAALAAVMAGAALVHSLIVDPWIWIGLRAIAGFCFSGLAMVIESWLNERTPSDDRGRVLGVYRLVDLFSVTAGQFVLTLADPAGFELFVFVGLFFALSLVPVAMTTSPAPAPLTTPRLRLAHLIQVSPLGTMGVFVCGLVNGTFRLIGPIYGQEMGLDLAQIATFMSAAILGAAVMNIPLGALSDRFDRRVMLLIVTGGALCAGLLMSVSASGTPLMLIGASFLFGSFAMPVYSLAVAHANDFAGPDEFVEVSAGLLLLYGVGAMIGPFIGANIIEGYGPQALFYYTSAVHFALILFGLYRLTVRRTVPRGLRRRYVAFLRTSPVFARIAGREHFASGERKP